MKTDSFYANTRYRTACMQLPLFAPVQHQKALENYWHIIHEFRPLIKGALWRNDWFYKEREYIERTLSQLEPLEVNSMARKTAFQSDYKFVNVSVDSATKKEFAEWAKSHSETWAGDLYLLVTQNWKHSLSFDEENVCFIASLTCNAQGNRYNKCVFTARSNEPDESILLVLFKVMILAAREDLTALERQNNWG